MDEFVKRFGGNRRGGGNKPKQPPKNQNKKLQTSQEWWEKAGSSSRRYWLEAYYAENSGMCEVIKKDERKCPTCRGNGTLRATRYGQSVDIICQRCHKSGKEIKVWYK